MADIAQLSSRMDHLPSPACLASTALMLTLPSLSTSPCSLEFQLTVHGASWSLSKPLEASRSVSKPLGASQSLLKPFKASQSLLEPLEAFRSLSKPLGASRSLVKPVGTALQARRKTCLFLLFSYEYIIYILHHQMLQY